MTRHLLRSIGALVTACALFLVLAGSAVGVATGSGGWHWQNPLPEGNDYTAGYFLNATHGWLVGGGDIFHTTDGGLTLTVQARHDVTFKAIAFAGARHGWAVGYPATLKGEAVIYRTDDGGSHWVRAPLALVGGIDQVSFSGPSIGWATSGRVALHSTDGGRHWTAHVMASHDSLNAVQTVSGRVAWVTAGGDTLLRTTNGGATWKRLHTGVADHLSLLRFTSPASGWVAGQGTIAHTSDGGAHWSMQLSDQADHHRVVVRHCERRVGDGRRRRLPHDRRWGSLGPAGRGALRRVDRGGQGGVLGGARRACIRRLGRPRLHVGCRRDLAPDHAHAGRLTPTWTSVQFLNATTGWAVGAGGAIVKTADGGATWTAQASGTTADLNAVHFIDAANGWAVGDQGVIASSTNGGATWTAQDSGVTADLLGVSFVDAQHGWAVGHTPATAFLIPAPVILATTDGGAHWAAQAAALPAEAELYDVAFADATHGWAVGDLPGDGQDNASVIVATTDGGLTWKRQLTHYPPQVQNVTDAVLTAVACSDARHAIAVGSDDVGCEIFRTTNGGATWTGLSTAARASFGYLFLSDIALSGATRAWAVGDATVLETSDGGATWRRQSVDGQVDTVSFVSPTHGWIAGANGDILTTTTAGNAP